MDGSLEALTREMSGERKAVFERVWQRVMGTRSPEDAPGEAEAPSEAGEQDLPVLTCPAEAAGSDYPRDLGVLGENCLEYVPLLQGLIRGALEDWRSYQALSRRAGGGPGRALSSIAQEERRLFLRKPDSRSFPPCPVRRKRRKATSPMNWGCWERAAWNMFPCSRA